MYPPSSRCSDFEVHSSAVDPASFALFPLLPPPFFLIFASILQLCRSLYFSFSFGTLLSGRTLGATFCVSNTPSFPPFSDLVVAALVFGKDPPRVMSSGCTAPPFPFLNWMPILVVLPISFSRVTKVATLVLPHPQNYFPIALSFSPLTPPRRSLLLFPHHDTIRCFFLRQVPS